MFSLTQSTMPRIEKALMDCAHELRSELENTTADVSGLFSKIGVLLMV